VNNFTGTLWSICMKNIFLIKTPLQLLNAIEARNFFNYSIDDCVLVVMGDRKSQPQILNLVNAVNEWGKVVDLNDVDLFSRDPFKKNKYKFLEIIQKNKFFKKSFFYIIRLNKISNFLSNVECIFIGYTQYAYMTHFVNVTEHKKLFFLDDGNGTVEWAKKRRGRIAPISNMNFKGKLKLYAKRFFQGIKDEEKEGGCFFSAYDISPSNRYQSIKNNFSYLRSKVVSLPAIDKVYFIGSPLSEVGIVSHKYYMDHLEKISKYFHNKELVYIAHRRDSLEKRAYIEKNLKMEVVLFDYPVEYQLAFIGPRPVVLASFFSAALDSCRLIFGEKLNIVSFRVDAVNSPQRGSINDIYASYESIINKNFSVISDY